MLADSAVLENASDIVADNVNSLPTNPKVNSMVYLLTQDGSFAPGLYIYTEVLVWTLLSNGEVVTD
jgi:hypothetical protein